MVARDALYLLWTEVIDHATFICVAGFILFMAWQGYKKGFMTMLLSLGSVVVTLIVDYLLLAFIMPGIDKLPWLNGVLDTMARNILLLVHGLRNEDEIAEAYLMSESTLSLIKEIIIFIGTFIIMQVVLRILMAMVKGIKRFKLIDWLDSILGATAGVTEGLIFVWIFMLVLSLFSGSALTGAIYRQIFTNDVLRFLYFINPVTTMLESLIY